MCFMQAPESETVGYMTASIEYKPLCCVCKLVFLAGPQRSCLHFFNDRIENRNVRVTYERHNGHNVLAEFHCEEDQVLIGAAKVICDYSGSWLGEVPRCLSMY